MQPQLAVRDLLIYSNSKDILLEAGIFQIYGKYGTPYSADMCADCWEVMLGFLP